MSQPRTWCAGILLSVVCVGLVACSSDDDASTSSTSTTAGEGSTSTSASPSTAVDAGPSTSGPPATAADGGVAVGANVLDPVAVGDVAELGGSVTTTVTSWEEVTATADVPGDIAGPAIAVTVQLRNGSATPIDASSLVVGAMAGDTTAPPNSGPPSAPMTQMLEPGAEASGVYVFRTPNGTEDVVVDIQTGFSPNTVRVRL